MSQPSSKPGGIPGPLVRMGAPGMSHRVTGRWDDSVSAPAFPSATGLGMEALSQMVPVKVVDPVFGLCSLLLPTLSAEGVSQHQKGPHTSFVELPLSSSACVRTRSPIPDPLTRWSA